MITVMCHAAQQLCQQQTRELLTNRLLLLANHTQREIGILRFVVIYADNNII